MTETTIEPPDNIDYGIVTARFIYDVKDGDDAGTKPDFKAMTGTVTFTASVGKMLDPGALPVPVIIGRAPIVAVIDEQGYLCTPLEGTMEPAYRWVELIATDDPDLNPLGWAWNVNYDVRANGKTLKGFDPHQMAVPAGTSQDLVNFIKPDAAQAIGIPQATALAAEARADAQAAAADAAVARAAAVAAAESVAIPAEFIGDELARKGSPAEVQVNANMQASVGWVAADAYRQPGDSNDSIFIKRAMVAAAALGIPIVKLTSAFYNCRTQINCAGLSGVTVEGMGANATTLRVTGTLANNANELGFLFGISGAGSTASSLTFRHMRIVGTSVDSSGDAPKRARATSGGGGLSMAFRFEGDLQRVAGGAIDSAKGAVSDILIEDVDVVDTNSLPWLLSGIRGRATVRNTRTINTMDGGWIFCESAEGENLYAKNSADNGFSFSRGNQRVIAHNIGAEHCAAYAVWIGGFFVNGDSTDYGPTFINASGLWGEDCGLGGVWLDEAPMRGVISGINIQGVRRGTTDGWGDSSAGTGIRIGGSPYNDLPNQTAVPTDLVISNFLLVDCAKGGIIVSAAKDVRVQGGLIVNPGSATDYDGVTVASTSTTENFGIATKAGSTSKITRFSAVDVDVIDRRTTPFANYAIWMTGVTDQVWSNVRGVNTRQTSRTSRDTYREIQGSNSYIDAQRLQASADFVNVTTVPGSDTAGRLYMHAGALKWRAPNGTVTILVPA